MTHAFYFWDVGLHTVSYMSRFLGLSLGLVASTGASGVPCSTLVALMRAISCSRCSSSVSLLALSPGSVTMLRDCSNVGVSIAIMTLEFMVIGRAENSCP